MKKTFVRYKQLTEAKINFDKSKGLQLGAGRDGIPLPGPFDLSDTSSRCVLGPISNWTIIDQKYRKR